MSNARAQGKGLAGTVMDRTRVANVRLDNFLSSHGIKQGVSAYPVLLLLYIFLYCTPLIIWICA